MAVEKILSGMTRGLFFANHASNYLPVRVRMPSERNRAVEMIRTFVREGDASFLKPEGMRRLQKGRFVAPISP
jgi:hypothetical protein